jgi:hypothetical protein
LDGEHSFSGTREVQFLRENTESMKLSNLH